MVKVSSKEALRGYLEKRVGVVVVSADLQNVAGGAVQYSRRLRELRSEGWKISSHHDRTDLKPGEYMLEELPVPSPPGGRPNRITQRVRAQVLERDGYTCQMCGVAAADLDDNGRKVRLHVGHVVDRSHGGTDDISNLKAICSACNQGAKNLTQEPPRWTWLLAQLRRSSNDDQKRALTWLKRKFEK